MKAFYEFSHKFDVNFVDWAKDIFEDKFSKFSQEMMKVEKWTAEFSKIKFNISLKLINQFISLDILIQVMYIPFYEEQAITLSILLKDTLEDGAT